MGSEKESNSPCHSSSEDDFDLPEIPSELEEYANEIRETVKNTICLKLKPATSLTPWQSKIGGEPYLPLTETYPCSSNGNPLMLLAQINFSEMPHLPGYPKEGILEFYIDTTDDTLGFDYENLTIQDGFRVLYFDKVEMDETKLHKDTVKYQHPRSMFWAFPLQDDVDYSIEFLRGKQYITDRDYRFYDCSFSERYREEDWDKLLDDKNCNIFKDTRNRIGGYPYFAQSDPRDHESEEEDEYDMLLLQLQSEMLVDGGINITWGDSGFGSFFIKSKDLENRNFKNVMYYWDCY